MPYPQAAPLCVVFPTSGPQATETLERLVSIVGGSRYTAYINFMVGALVWVLG